MTKVKVGQIWYWDFVNSIFLTTKSYRYYGKVLWEVESPTFHALSEDFISVLDYIGELK